MISNTGPISCPFTSYQIFSNFSLVQVRFPQWKGGEVEGREEEEVVLNDALLFGHYWERKFCTSPNNIKPVFHPQPLVEQDTGWVRGLWTLILEHVVLASCFQSDQGYVLQLKWWKTFNHRSLMKRSRVLETCRKLCLKFIKLLNSHIQDCWLSSSLYLSINFMADKYQAHHSWHYKRFLCQHQLFWGKNFRELCKISNRLSGIQSDRLHTTWCLLSLFFF